MNRPMLPEKSRETAVTERFGGYNHNSRIGEGEFFDMENLTSSRYPLLSPRPRRGLYGVAEAPAGLIAKDSLCCVDGSRFVMDGYAIELGLSEGTKSLVSMGAYVIIFPDGKYINTADLTDFGALDAEVTAPGPVTFSLCREDGADLEPDYTQPGEPAAPRNMQLWLDTSAMALKQWADTSGMWVDIPTTYVKISAPGIGSPFSQYDGITITGLKGQTLTDSLTGETIEDPSRLQALEGANVIGARGEDFVVITGILELARTIENPVTISRKMPLMDYVVERENRLWGCRYGLNREGAVVNEIYASKLGDFKNWNCFMGISTDSYAVSVGSDGPFTGAAVFGGYPLFFKENCVHKLFGDYPANFGIQTTACRGVQRGSHRSLAMVGELLYYKSANGVCVYDGALPREISAPLGQLRYRDGVGAGFENKYYLSMQEADSGEFRLFVYDTQRGLWHRESGFPASAMCSCRDSLYAIEQTTGRILRLAGRGEPEEEAVSWMAQTGQLGLELPQQKYISRMTVRIALEPGSWVQFLIRYDGIGPWIPLCTLTGCRTESFLLPIRPRRCDHFQLRLEGRGDVRIYSWQKILARGSDRP